MATPSLVDVMSQLETLRAELATLKSTPSVPRRGGASRRVTLGKYERHPGGSMAFQNDALDWNALPHARLTDAQLALWWTAEYEDTPNVPLTVALIRVVRKLHNAGVHGSKDTAPSVPGEEYTDRDRPTPTADDLDPDARRD